MAQAEHLAEGLAINAGAGEHLAIDLHVLGVHVIDAVAVIVDRLHIIDPEPDHVRGVELEAECLGRHGSEHRIPHLGTEGDVESLQRGAIHHRAVLDRNLHPAPLGLIAEAAE